MTSICSLIYITKYTNEMSHFLKKFSPLWDHQDNNIHSVWLKFFHFALLPFHRMCVIFAPIRLYNKHKGGFIISKTNLNEKLNSITGSRHRSIYKSLVKCLLIEIEGTLYKSPCQGKCGDLRSHTVKVTDTIRRYKARLLAWAKILIV